MAGSQNHSIQCTTAQESAELIPTFPIDPTLSFDSIFGGQNLICSLRSGDASFFCWDAINRQVKHVHSGPPVLTEVSVGARHVATVEGDPMKMQTIRWWRYGCHNDSQLCEDFPKSINGVFHSLTSGDAFTCAIGRTQEVYCWGPLGKSIMMRFKGVYMSSVTAGGSRMCGLNMTGHLICSGEKLNVPPGEAFEFTSLAVGPSHTCAIRRRNREVVCWGRYGSYFPMGTARFEFLVAGGDLTCGLTTDSLNVVCWGLHGRDLSAVTMSLLKIRPGVCMPDDSFCSCGIYPYLSDLCGGSGIICNRPDTCTTESFAPQVAPSPTTRERPGNGWIVFAFLATVLSIVGIVCLAFLKCLSVNQAVQPVGAQQGGPMPGLENLEYFSLNDINAATKSFSLFHARGAGYYGLVYKGKLSDGRVVAVKSWVTDQNSDFETVFITELEKQSKVHHANVVSLIGYCKENNQWISVFEYMKNKDLYGHLHPRLLQKKSQLLKSWRLRVKVLLDAARGIECLHKEAPLMIHRNINSENILINENWVAKISGFGFALFGPPEGQSDVEVEFMQGTAGYMDPECTVDNLRLTQKSDVYSFGVVILEVITGRKAFDNDTNWHLADLHVTRDLEAVLDRRLALPVGDEMTALRTVADVAMNCVRGGSYHRPTMSAVITDLEYALGKFNPVDANNN